MTLTALSAATLTLAMLLSVTLQAPLDREDTGSTGSPEQLESSGASGSPEQSSGEEEPIIEPQVNSCPNYHPGNPSVRNKTGCVTGTVLNPVDHELAFGFQKHQQIQNWKNCGIPRIPHANQRICYKTTLDQCGTDYRIFLNLRNEAGLQRNCPLESEELPTFTPNRLDRYFQSPRYGCRKGRGSGRLYDY